MRDSISIGSESAEVVNDSVKITETSAPATIETTNTTQAIVSSQNFVVSSEAAMGFAAGGLPQWLVESIDIAVQNKAVDKEQLIKDVSVIIAGLELGINQSLSSIENEVLSQNIKIDSNKSELDNNTAAVLQVSNTLVNDYSSTASTTTILAAEREQTNADIVSQATAIASDTLATSTVVNALVATVDDPNTGVSSLAGSREITYTSAGMNPDGSLTGEAGYFNELYVSVGEQTVSIDANDNITLDDLGNYTAITSKMITDGDGAITGWTTSQGSIDGQVRSEMMFLADKFTFANGANPTLAPFIIDTINSKINMSADVEIDGNLNILNGSLSADKIRAGIIYDADSTNADGTLITAGVYKMMIDLNGGGIHIQ